LLLRDHEKTPIILAASTWLVYNVFSFDTSVAGGQGWASLMGGWSEGGLRAGRGINNLEVIMRTADGKTQLSITINGKVRRTLDLPAGSGEVGLFVGTYHTSSTFDNFHFEELP
jgi:hypothetical protein